MIATYLSESAVMKRFGGKFPKELEPYIQKQYHSMLVLRPGDIGHSQYALKFGDLAVVLGIDIYRKNMDPTVYVFEKDNLHSLANRPYKGNPKTSYAAALKDFRLLANAKNKEEMGKILSVRNFGINDGWLYYFVRKPVNESVLIRRVGKTFPPELTDFMDSSLQHAVMEKMPAGLRASYAIKEFGTLAVVFYPSLDKVPVVGVKERYSLLADAYRRYEKYPLSDKENAIQAFRDFRTVANAKDIEEMDKILRKLHFVIQDGWTNLLAKTRREKFL